MAEEKKDLTQDLVEFPFYDIEVKEEVGEDGKKRMKVEGIIQQADSLNLNNRIYPKSVLRKAASELQTKIKEGKVFGELDHPSFRASLKDTSHLVSRIWWDEKDDAILRGEMTVTETPNGEILKEILRAGGRPGFSSRGRGELARKKIKGGGEVNMVKPGFRFSSFDFVIDPSVKSAQITKVIEQKLIEQNGSEVVDVSQSEKGPWYEDFFVDETQSQEEKNMSEEKKDKKEEKKATSEKKEDETVVDEKKKEDETVVDDKAKAELEKLRKEKGDLETELATKDETIEKQLNAITKVVEALEDLSGVLRGAGFMKQPEEKKEAEKDENEEKLNALETRLENLTSELDTTKENLKKKELEAHIAKAVEGKPYTNLLKERLASCKTVEEVDARLKGDEDLIKSVLSEEDVEPKGRVFVEGEGESEIKKDAKRIAGIKAKKEEK